MPSTSSLAASTAAIGAPAPWRRRQKLVNAEYQIPFTTVLLAQLTAVLMAIGVFAFVESQRTMTLVLRHLADFPPSSHDLHLANQAFLVKVIGAIAVTALVQILFGIYASHKLAGPIVKMTRLLDEAAAGHFEERVEFRKGDHMERLARSLNRMLDRLAAEQERTRLEVARLDELLHCLEESESPDPDRIEDVRKLSAQLAGVAYETPVGTHV